MGVVSALDFRRVDELQGDQEIIAAAAEAGVDKARITGSEYINIAFQDGMCAVTHDLDEEKQALVHPDELLRLIAWRLRIMESPDFNNPDAVFEPIEIEYEEMPPAACED